jgi:hypothetical protein
MHKSFGVKYLSPAKDLLTFLSEEAAGVSPSTIFDFHRVLKFGSLPD